MRYAKTMSDVARHGFDHLPPISAGLAKAAARPRAVAVICIVSLTGLGWLYLVALSASPGDVFTTLCRPAAVTGSLADAALVFAMWSAMTLAMMLPSAAPMVLTYAEIAETAARKRIAVVSPLVIVAGYVMVWLEFAGTATAVQLLLGRLALVGQLSGALGASTGAALFIGAGLYQFSTLKQACLHQCRNPFAFFFTNWTTTRRGVFRLGIRQGLYCLGCCWAAMTLMFAFGLMNLAWMAALAVAMTIEKLVPSARLSYGFGAALIAAGLFFMSGVGL
jgi:predicted metal-binding membrane protein